MFLSFIEKIIGSRSNRIIKRVQHLVAQINRLENSVVGLSDHELGGKTSFFKEKLRAGYELDDILPEAFAVVREATRRVLGTRHFDVQLLGGIVLHRGMVAEMRTGEGKTQVAALAAYLNALIGKGVHVVTVNDYLANRDSEWMGSVYRYLGLSVGCITGKTSEDERRAAYNADITYGTNNEFGFDFLRDHLKYDIETLVQRPYYYAIVDEADSVLIDEARTPLIISAPAEDNVGLYKKINHIVSQLPCEYYAIDEKQKNVILTDIGNDHIDGILQNAGIINHGTSVYDLENIMIVHHITQALRAHHLYKKDVAYLVVQNKRGESKKNGKILIVDEFTGRVMEGRRYSEGLHQALEAKEGLNVLSENQTIASVTFQNYFRMYPKLAGMTGTAATEEVELGEIYKLDVASIPTHLPMIRDDMDDIIYKTANEKYKALLETIVQAHEKKQPILVGTISVEKSEFISSLLRKRGIEHNVLNAKYHEHEAKIIAQAGRPGAVTIATNMAGRGTDIMLGGNPDMLFQALMETCDCSISKAGCTDSVQGNTPYRYGMQQTVSFYDEESKAKAEYLRKITIAAVSEGDSALREIKLNQLRDEVKKFVAENRRIAQESGGLFVIGTERHESRRIDDQLRGRSGRQGDRGASVFFLSLEDDLMRIFGSEKLATFLTKLGLKEDEAIVHPWISKSLRKAQQRVEIHNYEIRKNLLQFDDVMNEQRKVVYQQRYCIMKNSEDLVDAVHKIISNVSHGMLTLFTSSKLYKEEWDIMGLENALFSLYGVHCNIREFIEKDGVGIAELSSKLIEIGKEIVVNQKFDTTSSNYQHIIHITQSVFLMTLDQLWKDHLHNLDHLRTGIGLRAYGQKDPLTEYRLEAFEMFKAMLNEFEELVLHRLARVRVVHNDSVGNVHDGMTEVVDMIDTPKSVYGNVQKMNFLRRDIQNYTADNIANGSHIDSENVGGGSVISDEELHGNKRERRNSLCFCGSGKKYKHCHGSLK